MAASTIRLSSVLFLVLLVLAHSHVQARESKFFSKVTHSTNVATGDHVEEKLLAQIEIPAASPEYSLAPGPAPAYVEKEYGYGLYGHDSDMLPPARETYTPVTTVATATTTDVNKKEATATPATATADKDNNFEDQFVREELSGESFQMGYKNNNNYNYDNNNGYSNNYNYNGYANTRETNGYANKYNTNAFTSTYSTTDQSENYNTNGYSGNDNSNSYETERQGMSDTRYMENGKYSYKVKSDNSYLNGYEPEKAATGKQGMSDTRYMENGKYFYSANSDNSYLNGYEPEKAATGNYVNYDENSSNSNEFDTMEEYYKKQGYQESQEVHEP